MRGKRQHARANQRLDLLAMAVAYLGSICERRVARLIDPTLSWGLPRKLMSGVRDANTGYPVVQCSLSSPDRN